MPAPSPWLSPALSRPLFSSAPGLSPGLSWTPPVPLSPAMCELASLTLSTPARCSSSLFCCAQTLTSPFLASPKGSQEPLQATVLCPPGALQGMQWGLRALCGPRAPFARRPLELRASLEERQLVLPGRPPELASAAVFRPLRNSRANPTRRATSAREILALLTGAAGPGWRRGEVPSVPGQPCRELPPPPAHSACS